MAARVAFGLVSVNVVAAPGAFVLAWLRIMHPQHGVPAAFERRPDRSVGWAALESRQASALGRALRLSPAEGGFGCPPELGPFSPPPPPRRGAPELVARVAKAILVWALALNLCYLAATTLLIAVYRWVDPPATVLMAYRKWRFGWKIEAPKPVKLAKVPGYVKRMLVSIEDYKFYEHHGIDMEAFARAREINKRLGKPVYGGSTLTMQVARTLFLVPEKSYVRKYLEVLTAFELEALLSKQRILELYFGYAEWGKGVFGVEAASKKCYGAGVASISRDQAARLVTLLSSPIKYKPNTIYKSGILRERYAFLSRRYDQQPLPAEVPPASQAAGGPATAPAAPSAAPSVQEAPPPPSPEPDADGDAQADEQPTPQPEAQPAPQGI